MAYGDRYRTTDEMIELFLGYVDHYETEGMRSLNHCNCHCKLPCTDGKCATRENAFIAFGKADAYRTAAFELAQNLER